MRTSVRSRALRTTCAFPDLKHFRMRLITSYTLLSRHKEHTRVKESLYRVMLPHAYCVIARADTNQPTAKGAENV